VALGFSACFSILPTLTMIGFLQMGHVCVSATTRL
jgi:hypothetical protein